VIRSKWMWEMGITTTADSERNSRREVDVDGSSDCWTFRQSERHSELSAPGWPDEAGGGTSDKQGKTGGEIMASPVCGHKRGASRRGNWHGVLARVFCREHGHEQLVYLVAPARKNGWQGAPPRKDRPRKGRHAPASCWDSISPSGGLIGGA